MLFFLKEN